MYKTTSKLKLIRKWDKFTRAGKIKLHWKSCKSLSDAKKMVRRYGIKSVSQWKKFIKEHKSIMKELPINPPSYYKNWVSWYDFFGIKKNVFLPFNEARKKIRTLKLNTWSEWQKLALNKRPSTIPFHPERSYKNKGWVSCYDWIGKEI